MDFVLLLGNQREYHREYHEYHMKMNFRINNISVVEMLISVCIEYVIGGVAIFSHFLQLVCIYIYSYNRDEIHKCIRFFVTQFPSQCTMGRATCHYI